LSVGSGRVLVDGTCDSTLIPCCWKLQSWIKFHGWEVRIDFFLDSNKNSWIFHANQILKATEIRFFLCNSHAFHFWNGEATCIFCKLDSGRFGLADSEFNVQCGWCWSWKIMKWVLLDKFQSVVRIFFCHEQIDWNADRMEDWQTKTLKHWQTNSMECWRFACLAG
jgi:hypothetical protein